MIYAYKFHFSMMHAFPAYTINIARAFVCMCIQRIIIIYYNYCKCTLVLRLLKPRAHRLLRKNMLLWNIFTIKIKNIVIKCTSSWIQISLKNDIFCGFIINSSVLFPNLLELFFSDHWAWLYKIRKAPYKKKFFQKKNILGKIFKLLLLFLCVYMKRITKNFFLDFCPVLTKIS